jgi:hypothetical protein
MVTSPIDEAPEIGVDLSEEEASQGHKTGHMRWVLGIGLALACLGMVAVTVLNPF